MAFDGKEPTTAMTPEQELRCVALTEASSLVSNMFEHGILDSMRASASDSEALVLSVSAKFEAYLRFGS